MAGGLATPEPGETETAEFKGTSGLTEKKRDGIQPVLLKAVAPVNTNFDRVVFEFEGNAPPGYGIEYVNKPVRNCGRGEVVPIQQKDCLLIRLQPRTHIRKPAANVQNRN